MKNSYILSATILLASVILGSFYYVVEKNKQDSIEQQQEAKRQGEIEKSWLEQTAREREEADKRLEDTARANCAKEAQQVAVQMNKESCFKGGYCISGEGMYLRQAYENQYNSCLQLKGLK